MLFQLGPKPYVRSPASAVAPSSQTFVLLAFGQSNMVDQSGNDNSVPWPGNAYVLNTPTETYVSPVSPIRWLERIPAATADWDSGPGQLVKHFAINWCAAHPNDTLIVVPCARGGTGFLESNWIGNGSGKLYNETIRLLDKVFVDYPGAGFLAMLAQHGERDSESGNRTYLWNALQMINNIRVRYNAPTLPVIWGEPGPAAQFAQTAGAGYSAVRAQIRALPARMPYTATVREQNIATFDALTDIDDLHFTQASQKILGQLHYDALAAAQSNSSVTLPNVALIWQTAGEQGFLNFGVTCADIAPGDRLVVLACAHRSSGNPYIASLSVNGVAATVHLQQTVVQTSRIGLSVASVTMGPVPASNILPVTIGWGSNPTGGSIAIWRIRGGAAIGAGAFGGNANLGALSVSLSANLPGRALTLGYAVHTSGAINFTGSGTALVEGPGNSNATYFTTREEAAAGASATLTLTPSATPTNVCGMVAVAVGV